MAVDRASLAEHSRETAGGGPLTWGGRNCLVVGPAGSGKLTLARFLVQRIHPRARLFLLDWEIESNRQRDLIDNVIPRAAASRSARNTVLLLRRVDKISASLARKVSATLTAVEENFVAIYATARTPAPLLDQPLLAGGFLCRLDLAGLPRDRRRLTELVAAVIAGFNTRYGPRIRTVDPLAVSALLDHQWSAHLAELQNVLERAFLAESSPCLSGATVRRLLEPQDNGAVPSTTQTAQMIPPPEPLDDRRSERPRPQPRVTDFIPSRRAATPSALQS